jgi:hypothetical protein
LGHLIFIFGHLQVYVVDYQIMCKKSKFPIMPLFCPFVLFFFLAEKEPTNHPNSYGSIKIAKKWLQSPAKNRYLSVWVFYYMQVSSNGFRKFFWRWVCRPWISRFALTLFLYGRSFFHFCVFSLVNLLGHWPVCRVIVKSGNGKI